MIDAMAERVERISLMLSRHIIPLFIEGPGRRPQLWGSGLLVSAGDSSFLVSAAHVSDRMQVGSGIFIYVDPESKWRLSGRLYLTKIPEGQTRENDIFDVGVLRLEGAALPPYPAVDKVPLPVNALLPNALPREGKTYLIIGFPGSKSPVNPVK